MGSTVIGAGTKLDSLVMIGHNARIGGHGLLVAQVGIAGSTTIGHHATIAGQVGVAGHLKIGDRAKLAAKTGVMTDIEPDSIMMGVPAMPATDARRVYSAFLKLPELVQRIRELESQLAELNESGDTPIA